MIDFYALTVRDIALYPWLRNYGFLCMWLQGRSPIAKYLETIGARSALQKVYALLPTIRSSRDTAEAA